MTGNSLRGPMPPMHVLFERAGVNLPIPAQTRATVALGQVEVLIPDLESSADLPASVVEVLDRIMAVSDVFATGSEASRKRQVVNFDRFLNGYYGAYEQSIYGYLSYVSEIAPAYVEAISGVELSPLYDEVRQLHTYVTGTTGSGKTELLKAFVHHDVTHGNAAVIIDPQGNFARAVAEWPEFSGNGANRLVYINPSIAKGYAPALNPLDASHLTSEGREALAKSMTDVLSQVGGRGEWTSQAETIADNCFKVLVHQPGATLRDLRLAMVEVDRRARDIPAPVAAMQAAGLRHYNREVRDFFEYDFLSAQFAASRNSLRAKIGGLLRDDLFTAITCQPSKIFLEKLIDQRKIIIFDLGAWGDSRSAGAFGRMVLAQVSALGTRRSMEYGTAKTPVHVYVDEADLFVSPSMLFILSKLRQHGIHLTLAQQTPAYGYSGHDRDQLMNNTGIKFTAGDGQGAMLKMMNAATDATRQLRQGQFIGRWGRGEPFKLSVRRDLVKRGMSADEWRDVLQHQIATYYAPVETPQVMVALPSPSANVGGTVPTVEHEISPAEKMLRKPDESEWPD